LARAKDAEGRALRDERRTRIAEDAAREQLRVALAGKLASQATLMSDQSSSRH
jgi:hypothetical protein